MACPDYRALLSDYVSEDLSPEQVRLLKDHLPGCDSCRETVRLLRMDDNAVRRMLLGAGAFPDSAHRPPRLLRFSLFLVAALLLCLAGLYFGYGAVVVHQRRQERPYSHAIGTPLEDGIRLPAASTDLESFVRHLSRESGAPITLSPSADRRVLVRMSGPLAPGRTATLEAVLEALSAQYDLRVRMDGGRIHLE